MKLAIMFLLNLLFFGIIFFLTLANVRKNKDGAVMINVKLRKYAVMELVVILSFFVLIRVLRFLMSIG